MNSVLRKSAALLAAILLAASALSGCFKIQKIDSGTPDPISDPIADPAPPDAPETEAPDVKPAPVAIDYELLESALAIGLTGNGESYLRDPNGLWHVVGLYAALVGRTESRTPWLSDAACDALVRCLLPDEDPDGIPDAWFSDGGVVREERDGIPGVSFPSYEEFLNGMLGVWRELRRPEEEDAPYAVEVIDHLEDGEYHTYAYIAFQQDPGDGQTKLVYLVIGDTLREGGTLNFTLGEVLEQNKMSNLLRYFDAVTLHTSDLYGTSAECVWLRDGDPVYYETVDLSMDDEESGEPMVFHSESGSYRGLGFNTYLMAEPLINVWVTAEPRETDEYSETLITKYLFDDLSAEPVFVSEDDEDVTFSLEETAEGSDGVPFTVKGTFVVNKGTLALKSCTWEYEGGMTTGFTVAYNGDKLGEDVMKAWDNPRTLTLDIRTEAGERTEAVTVPASWLVQLLVDEGITVYFDEACRELTYNLIDAGGDITLRARDEANTPAAKLDISSVTLENVLAANYLTVLTEQYGSVKVHTSDKYAENDSWFFRDGDAVVRLTESEDKASGDKSPLSGDNRDMSFSIGDDGSVTARGTVFAIPAPYDPEYDENNVYIIERLRGGTLDEAAETDAGYTFRVSTSAGEYRCTADKSTLALTEIRKDDADYPALYTMEYGGELPSFADTYAKAMQKARTVTCHTSQDAQTYDWVFRVPADWSFYLWHGDNPLYEDEGHTVYADGLVPSDGKDYAFWMTDGMHAARADGMFFTKEQIISANLITALLKEHGQIFFRSTTNGYVSESQFFRYGSDVIRAERLGNTPEGKITDGSIGTDVYFESSADGKMRATVYVNDFGDLPNVTLVDNDGELYRNNYFLLWDLDDAEPEYVSETAYTVTFSVTSPYYFEDDGSPLVAVYTVDRNTLSILRVEYSHSVKEITYGENAAPFASEFAKAMADSRTVTTHFLGPYGTQDLVCRIPSAWEVELVVTSYDPDLTPAFWADANTSQPLADGIIPPNSGDVEVWATLGAG